MRNDVTMHARFVTLERTGRRAVAGLRVARLVEPGTPVARILIVDDDRSIRRTLEKFLGGEGHEVSTAQDAPGAIAAADGCEVMLLDLGLPGGSGFDVLTAISDRPRLPAIVVVTARDDMQSTVKAIQLGAFEYLVKPVD